MHIRFCMHASKL